MEYFLPTKESQKLIFKEWLCGVFFSGTKHKKFEPIIQFVLLGVFIDDPCNKVPYNISINALSVIFNERYNKIQILKDDMANIGIKQHGLVIKTSDQVLNQAEGFSDIKKRLHNF